MARAPNWGASGTRVNHRVLSETRTALRDEERRLAQLDKAPANAAAELDREPAPVRAGGVRDLRGKFKTPFAENHTRNQRSSCDSLRS